MTMLMNDLAFLETVHRSVSGMSEGAMEAVLDHAWMKGMVDLMRDSTGWNLISGRGDGAIDGVERAETMRAARQFAIKDPLCRRTLQLYRDLCFGQGFRIKPTQEGDGTSDAEEFWRAKHNRQAFGYEAQRDGSDLLLTDGERFYAVWGEGPQARVRPFRNPLEFTEVICNPDDDSEPWWYCRCFARREGGSQRAGATAESVMKVAYPAVGVPAPLDDTLLPREYKPAAVVFEGGDQVRVLHVKINNPFGPRGNSIFTGALTAAKGWRTFMQARTAIALAIARFALKKKHGKAGPAEVAAMANADESGLVNGDTENNPPGAFGANIHEGMGTTTTPMPQQTGGSDATQNAALFIARFGQFVGFPPYYYGVETLSRMATAGAMDRPVREMLEAWQLRWALVYADLTGEAIDPETPPEDIATFEYQPITERDLLAAVKAAQPLGTAVPALYDNAEWLTWNIEQIGVPNAEEITEATLALKEERREAMPVPPPPPPENGNGKKQGEEGGQEIAQALVGLSEGLSKANRFFDVRATEGDGDDG